MRLNRKWLMAIALVLSLTMTIGGTLAYLTDRDTVENVFTMGNVDIAVEENFEQNSPLYPGVSTDKEAGIKNIHATEPAYVWMMVSVPTELAPYVTLGTAAGYTAVEFTAAKLYDGYTSYVVKYPEILEPGESTGALLNSVSLDSKVDYQGGSYVAVENGQMTTIGADLSTVTIKVDGFAIQTTGFANVDEAFDAYNTQWTTDAGVLNGGSSGMSTDVSTLAELREALKAGGRVVLAADIKMGADETSLVVPAGVTVTLDMSGHTISQTKACTGSYQMLQVGANANLTITGNGKLSFTDTGAGDPNFGWGSYTIHNSGNLVVENGTIEHLGTQNEEAGKSVHMYCAIFQYSGSTTVNGGTIATPTYRSARLWSGTMTINGGNFDGRLWVQCVNDTSDLTINGGTFKPATRINDTTAIAVSNSTYDAKMAIKGGTFMGTVTCADANKLAGTITGGTFSADAKAGTDAVLFASDASVNEINPVSTADQLKAALTNGGTALLMADIDMGSTKLTVSKDTSLDLNGHVISGDCNEGQACLIEVVNGVTLNVNDSSADGNGKITYAKGSSNIGWTIDVKGELNLYAGTIELTGDDWSIGYAVDLRPNSWGSEYTEGSVFHMYGGKLVSSDGAVRVASSSADAHVKVSATFIMDGGAIDAVWDGVFIQQSNAAYDILNVAINDGIIKSAKNAIRFYCDGAATSVVGGVEKPMTLTVGSAAQLVAVDPGTATWYTGQEGKIALGNAMTMDILDQYATITLPN